MKAPFFRIVLLISFSLVLSLQSVTAQPVKIDNVVLTGNHITKDYIILRELPFTPGDAVDEAALPDLVKRARENLNNLLLFNFVDIVLEKEADRPDNVSVTIAVEERWYVWPLVEIKLEERNLSTWLQHWDFTKITLEGGVRIDNFLGLKHKLVVSVHGGYQWGAFLGYRDISLDREGKHFISLDVQGNISHNIDAFSRDNKPARFNIPGIILESKVESKVNYSYRPDIRTIHNITFFHEFTKLADTVLLLNPNYWGDNKTQRNAFRLNYYYRLDQRDYHPYPLNGYYVRAGLNTYISSNASVRYAQITLGLQYFKQLTESRWYVSTVFSGGLSISNAQAYILEKAIGYDHNMLRGYEYTVADGQSFMVSNNTLKYNILPKRTFTLNWLSWLPKFSKIHLSIYANAHFDMGYAFNKSVYPFNTLSNQFLFAGGLGLDIVTYYDLVLGFDYSINKQGRDGFFFSIKVPFI